MMGSIASTIRACCKQVHGKERWAGWRGCMKPASVERDGKWFCKSHDPGTVKARQDKTTAAYYDQRSTEALLRNSLMAIREIAAGNNDPRQLAQAVLDAYPKVLKNFIVTVRES